MRLICNRSRFILVREQCSEYQLFVGCHNLTVLGHTLDIQVTIVANFDDQGRRCLSNICNARVIICIFSKCERISTRHVKGN